jgi:ceramide glucosyltransferase
MSTVRLASSGIVRHSRREFADSMEWNAGTCYTVTRELQCESRRMNLLIWAAGIFCLATTLAYFVTTALALMRCHARRGGKPASGDLPAVSLIRPVCGIDNHAEETLRSAFTLDYPRHEVIYCVASAQDPVVPLIERLIAQHPRVEARLLIGEDRISDNPKLNNFAKGWRAAAYDWIAIADSNVLLPRDCMQRLFARWRADTGLVCSAPIASQPDGFWAELETAFLNTYQARWQYAGEAIGHGFAQGKTMLWRRDDLDRAGGVGALAAETAEDAAATKLVRSAGRRVRLVDNPFPQPLGRRGLGDVWRRQVRWARLRRRTFLIHFIPELVMGGVLPTAAFTVVAAHAGLPVLASAAAFAAVWYALEALLARSAGWHLSWASPFAWVIRDLSLPLLWIQAWTGNGFVWRGNAMRIAGSRSAA